MNNSLLASKNYIVNNLDKKMSSSYSILLKHSPKSIVKRSFIIIVYAIRRTIG